LYLLFDTDTLDANP